MSDPRHSPILTVTLNPALDLSSTTARVEPDHKLRCTNPTAEPGGGGVNVSRAIHLLGGQSDLFVALGGATGDRIASLIRASGIEPIVASVSVESRLALAVSETDRQGQYRFGFPGETLPDADVLHLREQLRQALQQPRDIVVLSGSLAHGMPSDTYASMIRDCRASGARVVLDAHGESLIEGLDACPWLIKLDYHESLELFDLQTLACDTAISAARALRDRQAAEIVIITLRNKGAVVASGEGDWRITPPHVTVRSAIGAGDNFVGALCLASSRGESLVEACRFGVATAAAAVCTPGTQLCERQTAEDILARTLVESL